MDEPGEMIMKLFECTNAIIDPRKKRGVRHPFHSVDLAKSLFQRGLQLFTTIKSNMKQKLVSWRDKILLRKRALIETVNNQLKNISQIEHTRHRSPQNFLINLLAGLAAYGLQEKKPSLNLDGLERALTLV